MAVNSNLQTARSREGADHGCGARRMTKAGARNPVPRLLRIHYARKSRRSMRITATVVKTSVITPSTATSMMPTPSVSGS
jgi:hypothetical protein